ncbi:ParB/RepB/Spo0J family partition protein [Amphibacillus xylanus]|uniref:Stage 0 sporulation protein J n=1 Tax=Amphibacillus xylanus (strain ATCC 51415 / DSM 6626 / JCM 7361 / LMG 17667 / NBRC 15112 / Ep01) TaxID=698758 RepID=K0J187_AMPXN|nr:ParB/RepB/Spo0J family partition protein [Amphibacillus xylanus]BAM48534.1 stage 0 sporulation protein J [Amphibacillus xylanus NBRC 15112]
MARGLGKGINAFFPELDTQEDDANQIIELDITELRPNPYQPRKSFQVEAIEELKNSIIEYGIIQPLLVRKVIKGYEIIAGERRYRAAKEANLEKIPVIVKELNDQKMMELALLENLQRENLTPVEEAQAYVNLMKSYQLTQEELSKKLGKSRPHIANHVRLLQLPTQAIAMLNSGELSMGHGRALLSLKNKAKIKDVIAKITKEKLNVRQVEQLVHQLNETKSRPSKSRTKKDVFIVQFEDKLRERLGTGVKIVQGKNKGKIEIEFFNQDDLNRIVELLD